MERWYWIELIGFDCEADDYGVGAFLSRNVSTDGVSLLFSHIDFIFTKSEALPDTACSYGAHEYNRERRRQSWTKTQLKGLIKTLKERGVKVFFSCFDMTDSITDPSMLWLDSLGRPSRLVHVLKEANGVRVGDMVINAISDTLDELGFDGLQLGDGLSSARRSIENGDFSLDLCRRSGISIPKRLMTEESYAQRRQWILKNKRLEWIEYMADGWADFYSRLFDRIKKPIIFNMAWTRDPFEALYRYGLDYRRCCIDKAYAIMIEENSATRSITAPEDEGGVDHPLAARDAFTYEYALMQQSVKLFTDGLRQISLMPISDTEEQWDALRHCPTELIRATVRRYNNFVYRNGGFEPCCNAPHYCLSDGISSEDWRWLAKQESYRIPKPDFIDGFAAVINKNAVYSELAAFCRKKSYFGSSLLLELIMGGLNLSAELSLSDVSEFDKAKCLVVTDLRGYTDAEKESLAKAVLPILAIGEDVELPIEKSGYYKGRLISVALYGWKKIDLGTLAALDRSVRAVRSKFGEKWTEPLSYPRVRSEFFLALCRLLNQAFEADFSEDASVKVNSFICGDERYLLLSNDRHTYCLPRVRVTSPVREATAIMKDKGYRVKTDENSICLRIPPRCAEIVKIKA